jgi:hypothetical protein
LVDVVQAGIAGPRVLQPLKAGAKVVQLSPGGRGSPDAAPIPSKPSSLYQRIPSAIPWGAA